MKIEMEQGARSKEIIKEQLNIHKILIRYYTIIHNEKKKRWVWEKKNISKYQIIMNK